jgi:hypothetical protein
MAWIAATMLASSKFTPITFLSCFMLSSIRGMRRSPAERRAACPPVLVRWLEKRRKGTQP